MREAMYYQPHKQAYSVTCAQKDVSSIEGRTGFCRARKNIGNKLYTENYARCSSCALDPIEKSHCIIFIQAV